ncbi:DUF6804 family protein [Spirosoma validum]|uniref:Uncharacterized protein n=1 Tax=Spirosoma validum TaxID=2771355 RepID=A0A927GGR4_9BACT|nr:DUF6804 family protein [Spirosoma validum]MBD2757151.1 hypothetical protein [Spirosoma validum]
MKTFTWILMVSIIGLTFPVFYKMQYGYYIILKFVICIAGFYGAKTNFFNNNELVAWLFILIAIVFNPLVPIHLKIDTWKAVDLITALFFLFHIVATNGSLIKAKIQDFNKNSVAYPITEKIVTACAAILFTTIMLVVINYVVGPGVAYLLNLIHSKFK